MRVRAGRTVIRHHGKPASAPSRRQNLVDCLFRCHHSILTRASVKSPQVEAKRSPFPRHFAFALEFGSLNVRLSLGLFVIAASMIDQVIMSPHSLRTRDPVETGGAKNRWTNTPSDKSRSPVRAMFAFRGGAKCRE